MWELLGALPVTSQWGKLFVCVCVISTEALIVWCCISPFLGFQGASKLYFQAVIWPPKNLWHWVVCVEHVATQQSMTRATKKQRHLQFYWLKHESELSPAQSDVYSLKQTLYGNSSTQWKQNTNTHNHAHGLSSGKYSCFTFWESWVE